MADELNNDIYLDDEAIVLDDYFFASEQIVHQASTLINLANQSLAAEAFDKYAGKLFNFSMETICDSLGVKQPKLPASSSYVNTHTAKAATSIATEAAWDKIREVVSRIFSFIAKMLKSVGEFMKSIFSKQQIIINKQDTIEQKIKKVKSIKEHPAKDESRSVRLPAVAKALTIDGKIDVEVIECNQISFLNTINSNAKEFVDNLNTLRKDVLYPYYEERYSQVKVLDLTKDLPVIEKPTVVAKGLLMDTTIIMEPGIGMFGVVNKIPKNNALDIDGLLPALNIAEVEKYSKVCNTLIKEVNKFDKYKDSFDTYQKDYEKLAAKSMEYYKSFMNRNDTRAISADYIHHVATYLSASASSLSKLHFYGFHTANALLGQLQSYMTASMFKLHGI